MLLLFVDIGLLHLFPLIVHNIALFHPPQKSHFWFGFFSNEWVMILFEQCRQLTGCAFRMKCIYHWQIFFLQLKQFRQLWNIFEICFFKRRDYWDHQASVSVLGQINYFRELFNNHVFLTLIRIRVLRNHVDQCVCLAILEESRIRPLTPSHRISNQRSIHLTCNLLHVEVRCISFVYKVGLNRIPSE